jgi:formamidopyrimidine-DNA glycosylase
MPEGHTIHRAAKDQRPMLKGQVVEVSSPQGRFLESAEVVDGQVCLSVEAYGKHLLYEFANGLTLHIHLGLFGKFKTHKRPSREPVGAVRVRMQSPTHVIDINGPNTCELLNPDERSALINRIGPDVLRKDSDATRAFSRISKSKAPIGLLLMDQSVIAGIGNIYRTEILWRRRCTAGIGCKAQCHHHSEWRGQKQKPLRRTRQHIQQASLPQMQQRDQSYRNGSAPRVLLRDLPTNHIISIQAAIAAMPRFSMTVTTDIGNLNTVPRQAHSMVCFERLA